MVLLAKSTQDVTQKTYQFVPAQNFDEKWTDDRIIRKIWNYSKRAIIH